jgi:hypothetical protein
MRERYSPRFAAGYLSGLSHLASSRVTNITGTVVESRLHEPVKLLYASLKHQG